MKNPIHARHGFTLIEVVVALLVLVLVWIAGVNAMVMSRHLASRAKHKVQALYAAQRILEEERRRAFSDLASKLTAVISLDTKGTFSSTDDDFPANRVITVTALDAYRKRVQVEVNWTENIDGAQKTVREFCATDIAKEPQLN